MNNLSDEQVAILVVEVICFDMLARDYLFQAHSKLQEEEHRAQRYLGTSQGCNSCELVSAIER